MQKNYFSLIELLVVIGILGALCSLMLPGFGDAQEDAKEKVVLTEMKEAQAAFRRFASDVMLKNDITKMKDIVTYGMWPLMKEDQPTNATSSVEYDDYDSELGIGRRGPYLRREGEITMLATPGSEGQVKSESGTVHIPVIADPFGGHYRVICPEINTGDTDAEKKKKLRKMALVCSGPDKTLNTSNSNLNSDDEIEAQGDDKAIRLMPLATY